MAESRWARHATAIGRTEFRRTVRAIRADTARAILLAVGMVGLGFAVLGMGALLALGVRGTPDPGVLPPVASGSVAMGWLFGVFILAQRMLSQHNRIDAESMLLTTVSARTVATGLLLAETLRALCYLLLPGVALTAVVAYGFSTPVSLLVVPVALACLLASAVLAGGLLGLSGALLVARYRFVARYKSIIGFLVVVLVMGPYVALQTDVVAGVSPAALSWLPVGWFAHLAVVGTPLGTSPTLAAGSVLTTVLLVGPGGVLLVRVAEAYWYGDVVDSSGTDRESPDPRSTLEAGEGDALGRTLGRFDLPALVARPSLAVARKALIRTRRNPNRLSFVLLPALIAAIQLVSLSQTDVGRGAIPPLVALGTAWVAGAGFGLNPLGDEGNVLPTTLTSGVSPRAFVRGVAYPGALFGAPLAVVATAVAGVAAGTAPVEIVGLVVLSFALTAFALPLAPAVGMRFPRFSAIRAGRSREVVPPSLTTAAIYTVPVVALGALGIVCLLVPESVAGVADFLLPGAVSPLAVTVVGYGGAVACCLLGGLVAYEDAVSTFEDYRVA